MATTPSRQTVWATTTHAPAAVEPVEQQRPEAAGQGHQINRPDRLRRRQAALDQPVRKVAAVRPGTGSAPRGAGSGSTEVVS